MKKDNKIFIVIALLILILAVLFFWRMNINQEGDEFVFVCPSGDKIHISYGEEAEKAYLSAQDKDYNLHRAISASGARYTNEDEKVVFWEHQGKLFRDQSYVLLHSNLFCMFFHLWFEIER